MRALLVGVVALAGACTRPCATGTLMVSMSLSGGAEKADTIDVVLAMPGGAPLTRTVAHPPNAKNWLLELDFSGRYPAGQPLDMTFIARTGPQWLATRSESVNARAQCTAFGTHLDGASDDTSKVMSLVAGAFGGPGRADDVGGAARFAFPLELVFDSAGNLYVADGAIRKLVTATNAVTTVSLPDLVGSSARPSQIEGLALDGAGNLYVADSTNDIVRKLVLATGAVSEVAGAAGVSGSADGIGAAARFNFPRGLALDGAGGLYVADSSNSTIRKIVLATGAVSTVVGTAGQPGSADGTGGAARLSFPQRLASDGAGNLYVADTNNQTIRKLVLATGALSTVAGSAGVTGLSDGTGDMARFNMPTGMVYDGQGNLYVADSRNGAIRRINLATGMVSMFESTPADGLALDGAGSLYIAASGDHVIRKLPLELGQPSTIAGAMEQPGHSDGVGGAAGFDQPAGLASDDAGNVYVADSNNGAVRKITLATHEVSTVAGVQPSGMGAPGLPMLGAALAVAVDGAGHVYLADSSSAIHEITLATGMVSTLAGTEFQSGHDDGIGRAARFSEPQGLALDGAGNLYVADTNNQIIRKVVLSTGEVSTLAGMATVMGSSDGIGSAARFLGPAGLAGDRAGNLYVADSANHTIRKLVLATAEVTTLAGAARTPGSDDGIGGSARFNRPTGVASDGAGNLYVADADNALLRKIVSATGVVTSVAGVRGQIGIRLGPLPTRISSPSGVVVLPTGEIIFSSQFENAILQIH